MKTKNAIVLTSDFPELLIQDKLRKLIAFCVFYFLLLGVAFSAGLIYPVSGYEPGSYAGRTFRPSIPNSQGGHMGEDSYHAGGTPVLAMADGVVKVAKQDGSYPGGYGLWYITIESDLGFTDSYTYSVGHTKTAEIRTFCYTYGHIRKDYPGKTTISVSVGQQVSKGDPIGYVNGENSTNGDGDVHLHVTLYAHAFTYNNWHLSAIPMAGYPDSVNLTDKANHFVSAAEFIRHLLLTPYVPNSAMRTLPDIGFDWSTVTGAIAYRIQVSTSPSGWTAAAGFPSDTLVVNAGLNSANNPNTDGSPGVKSSYIWRAGSFGALSAPVAGQQYWWTVRDDIGNTFTSPTPGGADPYSPITVQSATAASITVQLPNSSSIWSVGSRHTIVWSSVNPTGATNNLYLYRNGILVGSIASQEVDDRGYSWTIPASLGGQSLAGSGYSVRAVLSGGIADSYSSSFEIIPDLNSAEDAYEENDTLATAYNLSDWAGNWLSQINGPGIQADEDWYRISLPAGSLQVVVDLSFTHSSGDIDIALTDASGNALRSSTGATDSERIDFTVPSAGTYYLKVYFADAGNSYDLRWSTISSNVPDIEVRYRSTIPNGGSINTLARDFSAGGGSDNLQIFNQGQATLNISSITNSNPAEFTIFDVIPSDINPNSNSIFWFIFDPNAAGMRSTVITIRSNDPDEDPFTFTIYGEGLTPSDTTPPAVLISSPSNGATHTSAALTVTGTASDNVGVSQVFVRLNAGSYGTATGTTNWNTALTLVAGSNTISSYAQDTAGNTSAVVSRTVTYSPPDATPPGLVMSSPANGAAYTSAALTVTGTASDIVGVSVVYVGLNGGGYIAATGTTTWNKALTLVPGSNTISAYAQDAAGNTSAVISRSVTFSPSGISDDHGNTIATATILPASVTSMPGVLTSNDDDYFRITTPGPGTLIVWTSGPTNTYGHLYNNAGTELKTDDDSDLGLNFRLSAIVSAGNYYARVRGFSADTTGSYSLHYRFIPVGTPIQITYIEKEGTAVNLGFTNTVGTTYYIQTSADMRGWTEFTTTTGTGAEQLVSLANTGTASRWFFRVSTTAAATTPPGFSLIPAGTFTMGDQSSPLVGDSNETAHTVTLSAFYMGQTEVTYAQWQAGYSYATANGYTFDNAGAGKAANHPVHTVSWYDVVKWCNAKSQQDNLLPCYTVNGAIYKNGQSASVCDFTKNGYRLPTEAEWEKAARGGLSGKRFPWGDTITHMQANYLVERRGTTNYYSYDISATQGYHPTYTTGFTPFTSPAGSFAANGYGLYDMTGNVSEWCHDWYGTYPESGGSNYKGLGSGNYRVGRGRSWSDDAWFSRVANRYLHFPGYGEDSLGFRLARGSL